MNQSSNRINFLVQASESVITSSPNLSQYYGQVMSVVAEKSATKMDYTIKRRQCKKCRVSLIPGVNCSYRIKKKKSKKGNPSQVITCKECGASQVLILKRGHELKCETDGKVQALVTTTGRCTTNKSTPATAPPTTSSTVSKDISSTK